MTVMGIGVGLSAVHNDLSLFPKWFNDYIIVGGRSSAKSGKRDLVWDLASNRTIY